MASLKSRSLGRVLYQRASLLWLQYRSSRRQTALVCLAFMACYAAWYFVWRSPPEPEVVDDRTVQATLRSNQWLLSAAADPAVHSFRKNLEQQRNSVCAWVWAKEEDLIAPYPSPPANKSRHFVIPGAMNKTECNWIIYEAERRAHALDGWMTKRHAHYPTVDLDTTDIPEINFFINSFVYNRMLPRFESLFGLEPGLLGISETFVVKYDVVEGGQKVLAPHHDGSDFSFVVALNEGYEGGGTRFVEEEEDVNLRTGDTLLFMGSNRHMGKPVTYGTRYILAGFLHYGGHDLCEAYIKQLDEEQHPDQQ